MPFITFEGIEGCGKSTQARRLAEALGPDCVMTQEPGGTPLGLSIRALLLDRRNSGLLPMSELLLYYADRAQHVGERVGPALDAGRVVISDRYADSSIAYQGYGRGLSMDLIRSLTEAATGGLRPDVTFLLDVTVETGLDRVRGRGAGPDRLEAEALEFHRRVREGYLRMMEEDPERWVRIDGEAEAGLIAAEVLQTVEAAGWRPA